MEIIKQIPVFGFIALGGLIAMLPSVLLGVLPPRFFLKSISVMLLILVGFSLFYTLISDYSLAEILLLKGHPIGWPSRAISVPYILIFISTVLLPISIITKYYKKSRA